MEVGGPRRMGPTVGSLGPDPFRTDGVQGKQGQEA